MSDKQAPIDSRGQNGLITLKGVRVHNLKNLDLQLPRRRLVVVTGPSGSGKSSLAFDTLYAEGQRRYIESLSSFAHQFLDQLPKPDVDRVEGLSPALAIDQKGLGTSPRSTVGTTTEISSFLRLLFARVGVPWCPDCDLPAASRPLADIEEGILGLPAGTRFYLLAPVVRGRKGQHRKLLDDFAADGYVRALVDGELRDLGEPLDLVAGRRHDIAVVVDGLTVRDGVRDRLRAALATAAELGEGSVLVLADGEPRWYSRTASCPGCGRGFPEPDPRLFSFNSPVGSCPACNGLGTLRTIPADMLVPDPSLSLEGGAVEFLKGKESSWLYTQIEALAGALGFAMKTAWQDLSAPAREVVLHGLDPATDRALQSHPHYQAFLKGWTGLVPELVRRHRETKSERIRANLERIMAEETCPACRGWRLCPAALDFRVGGLNLGQVGDLTLAELDAWVAQLAFAGARDQAVARPIVQQVQHRLRFLLQVGVSYLTLSRGTRTLSGGEGQRVRLATQVGSQLTGVLYVLDEPSVGLHHRDIRRLIETLEALRDRGNSVVVVEHDRDVMLAADHLIDLGPGAGEHGGRLVAQGTVAEVMATEGSATGDFLAGRAGGGGPAPLVGRPPEHWLRLAGLRGRNLKDIELAVPLERLVVVTGVSGSGKSTAVHDTLHRVLAARLHRARKRAEPHGELSGDDWLQAVVLVDQSPIGRSPRSTPATYTGLYGHIRKLYAQTNLARIRGYDAGRFSFNTAGGRCAVCEGAGVRRLTMDFLPDVEVPCEECQGRRFDRETLEVHFKGRDIAQLLDMSVDQARELLETVPACRKILETMQDVGLGYLRLGQAGATLSGGEAQRLKLVKELARGGVRPTLYILDEPTTGLHCCDVDRLLHVLAGLIAMGNSVLVIEHNPEVVRRADWVIDLGPEGGAAGGELVVAGSLADVAACARSYTGAMLREQFALG
ncbi:MAG TPA: excinuclease ABC subunit UvrA [Candidatus Krumholzibacteria bacterium]|nr:excinuclease ABC subunit UvrA [Candidatus Krumholzibacteria bacterium]HPD71332.1 excinuclease ABC subunit UvrA [Candidatus Krumholzibacteria bacterium]HRY38968.1 excinuclease ABC subunit UvrA [Candidatus Krumholzibacteria bacterium]